MQLTPGTLVAERFRLERLLGKGGMGGVWRAHHVRLDVPCAVKFIHPEAAASPDLRARFEREARAAAQIRSPNVVQILDHGVWEGLPYIAMELLVGEDLAARLKRQKPLPPREALAIAAQVGRALTKAHAAGVVHRDLKPGNIYLARDDEETIVKVLDFGVAKDSSVAPDTSTQTGTILGTPFYMSPEQARGNRAVDHRSDLWALAVVVFQMLVGKLPFHSSAVGDLFVKIIVEPPPVPSQHGPVPPGFDAWWARATQREPGDRFQSAKELVDALAPALGLPGPEALAAAPPLPALPPPTPPPRHPSPFADDGPTVAVTPPPVPGLHATPPPYAATPLPHPSAPHAYPSAPPSHASTPIPHTPMPAPVPPSISPPTPTPVDQALTVHPAPATGRGPVIAVGLAAVLVLGGAASLAARARGTPADATVSGAAGTASTAGVSAQAASSAVTDAPSAAAASASAVADAPSAVADAPSAVADAPSAVPDAPSAVPKLPAPAPKSTPSATPGSKRKPGKPAKDFGI